MLKKPVYDQTSQQLCDWFLNHWTQWGEEEPNQVIWEFMVHTLSHKSQSYET